jgi:ketosteroid isomerase-like protein
VHDTQQDFSNFLARREAVSTDFINGKPEGLLKLSTHHNPATFFPPSGARIGGAAQVNDVNGNGAKSFGKGSTGHFERSQRGSSGDIGFWTGIQHANTFMKGHPEPAAMEPRKTEVFRREGSQWMLFYRHADTISQANS